MSRTLIASNILCGSVALLGLIATPSMADWAGSTRVDDAGHTHIDNPATPMEKPTDVTLEPAWTIGGDSDSDDEFFGVINQISVGDDDNVFLLDSQLSAVKVFSSDGEFVREFGSEGEGPGEFRGASDMFRLPGGTIGVLQVAPGRIVQFSPEGDALGDHPVPKSEGGGFTGYLNGRSVGDELILACFSMTFGEQKMTQVRYLAAVGADGTETVRYHSEDRPFDMANPTIDEATWDTFDWRWTAGPDGRVYAVPRSGEYTIRVWNPDGSHLHDIHREDTPLPRTDEEKAEVKSVFERFTAQMPNATITVNDHHRTIEAIYVREDNSLWVATSRGIREHEGTVGTFDVFDADGHFTRQVTVKAPANPKKDRFIFDGDRLFVISGWMDGLLAMQGGAAGEEADEEAEPMAVTCYRLEDTRVALN